MIHSKLGWIVLPCSESGFWEKNLCHFSVPFDDASITLYRSMNDYDVTNSKVFVLGLLFVDDVVLAGGLEKFEVGPVQF